MNRNTYVLGAFSVLVASAIAVTAVDEAHADVAYTTANDVYTGTGWKIFTAANVFSINRNQTMVITYDSTAARTKLSPMVGKMVAQLRGQRLRIFNSTLVETTGAGCPAKGHFTLGIKYRPSGADKGGSSRGLPCYNTVDHSLFSGRVWFDSEYKQLGGTWSLSDKLWKNCIPHEFGHAIGLDHPSGAAHDAAGDTPTMTAPNGGWADSSKWGTYTPYDLAGIKALIGNYDS